MFYSILLSFTAGFVGGFIVKNNYGVHEILVLSLMIISAIFVGSKLDSL
mgnify:CR=1 FL=1